MSKVIFLSAKRRAGKDTLADYLVERHGFVKVAFADRLKDDVAERTGIPRREFDDPLLKEKAADGFEYTRRQLLQKYGAEKRRKDRDYFIREAVSSINQYLVKGRNVVISDARFPNELDAKDITPNANIIKVRIHRPERERLYGVDNDPSEIALDDYGYFDVCITNQEGDMKSMFDSIDSVVV